MGCRTQAWVLALATAYFAWACMAARAVCRRKVCGVAPQDVKLLKALEPAELRTVGLDPEGPDQKNVGR